MTPVEPVAPNDAKAFTGRHMWMLMAGFFGVVLAVNIGLAVLSVSTWTGLAVDNSYVASQQFQDRLDALHAQQALGWQPSLTYAAGTAQLVIRDGAGNPVDIGVVTLGVNRPIGTREDRMLALDRTPDGVYEARLDLPPGAWDAVATAPGSPAGPFELRQRFLVNE